MYIKLFAVFRLISIMPTTAIALYISLDSAIGFKRKSPSSILCFVSIFYATLLLALLNANVRNLLKASAVVVNAVLLKLITSPAYNKSSLQDYFIR
ncbi:hypothetical protein GGP41_008260 [Bipolaris sorokiniana]|uniref:Uncharacterized protein n=1 Tax=Cochliobolus sativus TaxID=45130 RepID=A0A8H5ZPU6_COCSA|nr:hypothetical protein GGP41_008260 [Bipolaris sorokiniana]